MPDGWNHEGVNAAQPNAGIISILREAIEGVLLTAPESCIQLLIEQGFTLTH
jgi:hypothetical protein